MQKRGVASFLEAMKRKSPLTLLEVLVCMVLLGTLLTGLFNALWQGLKTSMQAKELKQQTVHIELFQQKMKALFSSATQVWTEKGKKHPCLKVVFMKPADPKFELQGEVEGTLFLNEKKQLRFSTGLASIETFLRDVSAFQCDLFNPKTAQWTLDYPKGQEQKPAIIRMHITSNDQTTPFVFFLHPPNKSIDYPRHE